MPITESTGDHRQIHL